MFCCSLLKGRQRGREEEERTGERWRVRVVVVGDTQSGKSCLIQRYCRGSLPPTYTPTLFDTCTTTTQVDEKQVQVIIQDTAGQEDLDRLRPPCYLHADVIMVCFTPGAGGEDRVRSLWVPEIRRCCGKHVPLLLVANKADQDIFSPAGQLPLKDPRSGHLSLDDPRLPPQGQHVDFVDRLKCSVGGVQPVVLPDPHSTEDEDDVKRRHHSQRDCGLRESRELLVPCKVREEKRSLLAQSCCQLNQPSPQKTGRLRSLFCATKPQPTARPDYGSTGQRGHHLALQVGAVGFFRTSALRNQGVDHVFHTALLAALRSKQWRKKYRR